MSFRYCPQCGTEYRSGFTTCSDCGVLLVGVESGALDRRQGETPTLHPLKAVFLTGRRSEAELVRSFLDAHSIEAHVWSSGLSPWRIEAALTEITGLANDFGSHRVMVPDDDSEQAEALLVEIERRQQRQAGSEKTHPSEHAPPRTWMDLLRSRWAVLVFALFLLMIVLVFGPPEP